MSSKFNQFRSFISHDDYIYYIETSINKPRSKFIQTTFLTYHKLLGNENKDTVVVKLYYFIQSHEIASFDFT